MIVIVFDFSNKNALIFCSIIVIKFCLSILRQAKIGLVQKAERYRIKYNCVFKTINKTSIWEEASMAVSRSIV